MDVLNEISLLLEQGVEKLMEERGIREADVIKVLQAVAQGAAFHKNLATGRALAYHTPASTTFWVEYRRELEGFRIFNAYSHRMKIIEGFNMPSTSTQGETCWSCAPCDLPLEPSTVKLKYLDETFAADLPACPRCQRVLVNEEQAVVKMAMAERMLEDK